MFKKLNGTKLNSYIKKGKQYTKIPKSTKIKAPKATKAKIPDYNFGSAYENIFHNQKPFTNDWY